MVGLFGGSFSHHAFANSYINLSILGRIRLVRPIADFRANTASLAEAAELAG